MRKTEQNPDNPHILPILTPHRTWEPYASNAGGMSLGGCSRQNQWIRYTFPEMPGCGPAAKGLDMPAIPYLADFNGS